MKNSGLGCGCGGSREDDLPTVASALLGQSEITYFRQGIASGVAWVSTLVNGISTPIQWNNEMAITAIRATRQLFGAASVLDRQLESAPDRNRAAFVFGFDVGVQLVFGTHTTLIANGQVYTLDALRTQGRDAANSVFEPPRAATDSKLGYVMPSSTMRYGANPAVTTVATGRPVVTLPGTVMPPARNGDWYFREGMAFGSRWNPSGQQSVRAPEWNSYLQNLYLTSGRSWYARQPRTQALSNRQSFIWGFQFPIRQQYVEGDNIVVRTPSGLVRPLELYAQAAAAANAMWGTSRPPLTAPFYQPSSVRSQLIAVRNAAASRGPLISIVNPPYAAPLSTEVSQWIDYLSGRTNSAPAAISQGTYEKIRDLVETARLGTVTSGQERYIRDLSRIRPEFLDMGLAPR